MAEDKKKDDKKADQGQLVSKNDKQGKHPKYYKNVKVVDINGFEFTINATVPGPIKVETSHMSHAAYNPDLVIEKVAKGRVERYQEMMKKMEKIAK